MSEVQETQEEQEKKPSIIYVTLKDLVNNPMNIWKNKEPKCFLCSQDLKLAEHQKSFAAINLELFSSAVEAQYAVFHECCLDLVAKFFSTLFKDKLIHIFFEGGLEDFIREVVGKDIKSVFTRVELQGGD